MKSTRILAAIAVLVGILSIPAIAQASVAQTTQELCDTGSYYPPSDPGIESTLTLQSGTIVTGGTATIQLSGADAGADYCGVVFSTPFRVSGTAAADGSLVLTGPASADFDYLVNHRLEVYRSTLVGNFTFCVSDQGTIDDDACPDGTGDGDDDDLAKTGTDLTETLVKLGAGLVALGAAAVFLRRRRILAD